MKRLQTGTAIGLVGFSLLVFIVVAAFEGGRTATPYGTIDSKGFVLGFNNPLTLELCGIMLKRTSLSASIDAIGFYGVTCFAMQVLGLIVLFLTRHQVACVWREWFFSLQVVVFPFAWVGMLFAPFLFYDFITGRADGETISDGPSVWWIAQGTWIATAISIFFLSRVARPWAISLKRRSAAPHG